MILRARVVLPLSQPPIADGAVLIRGERIAAVGPWRTYARNACPPVVDLGEVLLMPGLVNAHCHLDYTHMAGQIPPPKSFTEWLKVIVATKAGWTLADYEKSWKEGADMLLRNGTTTVADMEAVPELLPVVWHATPLRVISFLELIGITQRRPPTLLLDEASQQFRRLGIRDRIGLAPHAPYSTVPELLRLTARLARQHRYLIATHVAESKVEYDMFVHGRGDMFDWLARSGRNMSDCGKRTPVQHLAAHRVLGPNLLATHVNYLGRGDAKLLAESETSVVHCPRSHFYFRHAEFPLKRLFKAGVNLCLGTDSLASVYKPREKNVELSMFAEMECLARQHQALSPRRILEMATLNGAKALRLGGKAGELARGASADLITVPFTGAALRAYEAVVFHQGPVSATMIRGQWNPTEHPRRQSTASVSALRSASSASAAPLTS